MSVKTAVAAVAIGAALCFGAAYAQEQKLDTTALMTLLGGCTYQEAVLSSKIALMQKEEAATALWWAQYIGKPEPAAK